MNTDKIEALLERVEKATEPDFDLEVELVRLFFGDDQAEVHRESSLSMYRFTESTDAADNLVEQTLPGWSFSSGKTDKGCFAYLWASEGQIKEYGAEDAPSKPLAIIAALLRAKLGGE